MIHEVMTREPHCCSPEDSLQRPAQLMWTRDVGALPVAERTIQTMKLECIWLRDWTSIHELQQALTTWQRIFNDVRPHQALAWATPSEVRTDKLGLQPAARQAA